MGLRGLVLVTFIVACQPTKVLKLGEACGTTAECVVTGACLQGICTPVECRLNSQCQTECDLLTYTCKALGGVPAPIPEAPTGDPAPSGDPAPPTLFSIELSADTLNVDTSGNPSNVSVTITRTQNAALPASFNISGGPANLTLVAANTTDNQTTLTFSATPGEAAGPIPVTLVVTINGVSQNLVLTVNLSKLVTLNVKGEFQAPPNTPVYVLYKGNSVLLGSSGTMTLLVDSVDYAFAIFFQTFSLSNTFWHVWYMKNLRATSVAIVIPTNAQNTSPTTLHSNTCTESAPPAPATTAATHAFFSPATSADEDTVPPATACDVNIPRHLFPPSGSVSGTKYAMTWAATTPPQSFMLGSTPVNNLLPSGSTITVGNIVMTPAPTVTRTVNVTAPSGSSMSWDSNVVFGKRTSTRLQTGVTSSFSVAGPVTTNVDTRVGVTASLPSGGMSSSYVYLSAASPVPVGVSLTPPATLLSPAANALYTPNLTYSWQPVGGAASILEVAAEDYPWHWVYRCYTTDTSCQLPSWTAIPSLDAWEPFTLSGGSKSFVWRVYQHEGTTVPPLLVEQHTVFMDNVYEPTTSMRVWDSGPRAITGP